MFIGTSLYYFTTDSNYSLIARQGFIEPTESFLLPPGAKGSRTKRLILLTSEPKPDLTNLGIQYTGRPIIRITVKNHRDFCSWKEYVASNHLTKDWCSKVEAGRNPQLWYISDRRILKDEIIEAAVSDAELAVDMMAFRKSMHT